VETKENEDEEITVLTELPKVKNGEGIVDDKFTDLLFNVIQNKKVKGVYVIGYDYWLKILICLKSNGYDKSVFLKYSQERDENNEASNKWDAFKVTYKMNMFALYNIAKELNYVGYRQWLLLTGKKSSRDVLFPHRLNALLSASRIFIKTNSYTSTSSFITLMAYTGNQTIYVFAKSLLVNSQIYSVSLRLPSRRIFVSVNLMRHKKLSC
jgi:hypothetical protein